MVPKMLSGWPLSASPPSKLEAEPKMPLKIKMPIKRQIKIAKAEIISGKPPDVFFVFILVFIYI